MIKIDGIRKSFGNLDVLKEINFQVAQGEIISIVGASGSGKTTLLQIVGTLLKADSGTVEINGTNPATLNEKELSLFRNSEIGFIFQFHNLLAEFTALENVAMPGYIAKRDKKEVDREALNLLETLGLKDRVDHKPSELSGGEKQRVAVARALINNPSIILADEPTGSLDSTNRRELYAIINKMRDLYNHTFIVVTHDEEFSIECDRTLHIRDGEIY